MPQVTIDGKEYDFDSLSDKAKANLISLQFVQAELKKFEAQIAVHKTAERAYSQELGQELNS